MVTSTAIAIQLLNGLSYGSVMALVATGLSIVFGIQKVVNFAHGVLYALGAYVAFSILEHVFPSNMIVFFLAAAILAGIIVGLFGILMEISILRPIYESDDPIVYSILATFGVLLVMREVIILIWTAQPKSIAPPAVLSGAVNLGITFYPKYRLFLILVALGLVIGTWLLIEKTAFGSLIRASTENPDIANAMGVNVNRVNTSTFMLGALLAGIGGALHVPMVSLQPFMDIEVIVVAFVVVVIGGIATVEGALLGGILVGVVKGLVSVWAPELALMAIFATLAVVLLIRPTGLAGRGWREDE